MGIEVVCALIHRDDKVWMGRRPAHKHMGGKWEFPGGKIDPNESPQEALKRELKEELGVEIKVGEVCADVIHEYPDKVIRLRAFIAECDSDPELIEHSEFQWIDINTPDFLEWAPADIDLWQSFQKYRRNKQS